MNFTFEPFLLVDGECHYNNHKQYATTLNGQKLFNINALTPIIKKGYGCIGVAQVSSICINEYNTEVIFTFHQADSGAKDAYYNLYRNSLSLMPNPNMDYDDDEDLVIPGLMGKKSKGGHKERPTFF